MTLRAALVQTRNAYAGMPERVEDLPRLADRLDAVRDANVVHNVALVREAARRGAQLVGLGELFPAPYFALHKDPMWLQLAEDALNGPTIAAVREAAAAAQVVVVAPIDELAEDGARYNTAVVVDADGAVLGRFRKLHIPCGSNERGTFTETFDDGPSRGADGGSGHPYLPVFRTRVGVLGVAICYDRHFEGVVATLAAQGARLVLCPAVTFGAKSERMWPLEFAVDAVRHRVCIGGSNRAGAEAPWNIRYFGDSHFVSPEGRLPDLSDHPELVISDLDLAALEAPDPSGWDLQRDRRPEVLGAGGHGTVPVGVARSPEES